MEIEKTKKTRADGQISGLAGEFFVAGELLKRDLQVAVTFGNAKAIDLFACNPKTNRNFTVQVKALRKKNYFPISHTKINSNHVYVFVVLNSPRVAVEYFIVPGSDLMNPNSFSKWFIDPKFPGIFIRTNSRNTAKSGLILSSYEVAASMKENKMMKSQDEQLQICSIIPVAPHE